MHEGLTTLANINLQVGWAREWAPRILAVRERAYEMLGDYDSARVLADSLKTFDPSGAWQRVAELRVMARQRAHAQMTAPLADAVALPPSSVGWETFDPGDLLHQVALATAFAGDSARADSMWRASDRWYAEHAGTNAALTRAHVRVLMALHRDDQAKQLSEQLLRRPDAIPEDLGQRALVALRLGDRLTATTLATTLEADSTPNRFGQPRAWAARIASALGQSERAVQLLYRARREGFTRLQEVQVDPTFAASIDDRLS